MKKASEIIKLIEEAQKEIEIMPTMFKKLDDFLDGGFFRKELIMVGAPSGLGKSYVAGQFQYNIAKQGFKTAYYSLEISNETVMGRLIGAQANLKPARITTGKLEGWERDAQHDAQGKLIAYEDFMLFEDDMYELEELQKSLAENKPDFVVIDFIQNIELPKVSDENLRLARIARELQKTAKQQNCCILVLSQLSNANAKEKVDKITNAEYRGSGAIAHVADLCFFLERGEQTQGSGEVLLYLKKNRRGQRDAQFNFLFRYPGGLIIEDKRP